ncbi:outer membrane beta-barrel protein [Sphingobacterium sp. UME9]|uniref:outer membrane beta-barrel protein n=1 Tax=Sphingobacterium sp. UME9 TaxID=1862316 RepID=UPI0015FF790C|nr:outer membrane beta-barrel protein [Sphingobacterium sp. UME9]MBB1645654.1 hypothetical protein [Sphingobacterium sp. UME9]
MLTLLGLQTVSAQETPTAISKGKWMVETNLSPLTGLSTSGFSFYSNNGAQLWSVGGEAGYFFQDKLAVKAGLGFTGQRYVFDFDGQKIELNSTHSFIYKAGLKYYIINQFPVQVDLGGINSGGENAFIFGGQLGYALFLKENIAIEPAVRYDHGLNDNADGINAFSARIGFSLHF